LYLRKSDEYAKDEKFEDQERICREYAVEHGYTILGVYQEKHSGKHNPLTRHVLHEVITLVKHRKVDVVVIRDYDRLARTIEQTYAIIFEVEHLYHGRIEAAGGRFDRTSSTAKLQFTVLAAANELERDRIYERTETGKRTRAEKGLLMASSHPLYGYQWKDDEVGKRTTYEEDPESAKVVRLIYGWAADGWSTMWITRTLNARHIPSPSAYAATQHDTGNRKQALVWHRETVRTILRNPGYAGRGTAYRYKYMSEYRDLREVTVRAASDKCLDLPSTTWPAIVSGDVFDRVQQRIQNNRAGRMPANSESVLMRGHVYCGVCGHRMTGSMEGGKRSDYAYQCSRRPNRVTDPSRACPRGHFSVRCHAIDQDGWEGVKVLLRSRETFAQHLRDKVNTEPREQILGYVEGARAALQQKTTERDNLAKRVGMTSDDMVA
jgi:site-specific DNA recombinase